MRQRFHTIIRPEADGRFVAWVEEIPGTITTGRTLGECRARLRDALELMLATCRHEARLGLSDRCICESIEVDVADPFPPYPPRPATPYRIPVARRPR